MKQILGIFIVSMTLALAGYYIIGSWAVDAFVDVSDKHKVLLDRQVINDGDTLTITDYSMVNGNVTLDNGTTMNVDLARKRLLEEVK